MKSLLKEHPWVILVAGAFIQILTGIPAAWGVFQQPIMGAYAFSEDVAAYAFSVLIAAFSVGCILGGAVQDKRGPRCAAALGTLLLSGGFLAGSLLPAKKIAAFYLLFSIPVGLGCAFLYPSVMSCAQKWYRQKKGLATGVIGGAVGLSGAFLTLFVRKASGAWGIRLALAALAAVVFSVCGLCSLLIANPQPEKPRPDQQGKPQRQSAAAGCPPAQMLKTGQYWLLVGAVFCSTAAVLLFSPILVRLGQERGLSEGAAHLSIVVGSVGSAAGRLLMPILSDKIGRRKADLILYALLCGLSVCFLFAQSGWMIACYSGLTFCYSGAAALLPAFGSDLFGLQYAGSNYGFLALGMGAGSLSFPLLAQALGLKNGRHFLAIAAAAVGFVLLVFIKPQAVQPSEGGT